MKVPECKKCASLPVCRFSEKILSLRDKVYNATIPELDEIDIYPIRMDIDCAIFREAEE